MAKRVIYVSPENYEAVSKTLMRFEAERQYKADQAYRAEMKYQADMVFLAEFERIVNEKLDSFLASFEAGNVFDGDV